MSVDAELAALLKAPQAGLRLIHLHLGRLAPAPSAEQRQTIRQALRELGRQADAWRLFDIASGDLLMLYQGVDDAKVQAACRRVSELLPGASPTGINPYGGGAGALYDVLANPSDALRCLE